MTDSQTGPGLTGTQQLVGGVVSLALATACILALPTVQSGSMAVGIGLGLLTVAFLVIGTLSIGTSEQLQV